MLAQFPPPFHGSNIMTERFYDSLKKLGYKVSIVEKTFSRKIEQVDKITVKKLFKIPIFAAKIIYSVILTKTGCMFLL